MVEPQERALHDPGEMEGVPKPAAGDIEIPQKEHEPGSDHPRFKEIYNNWKTGERKIEDLNTRIADTENAMGEFRKVNTGLTEAIKDLTDTNASSAAALVDEEYNTKVVELRKSRDEAFTGQDFKVASNLTNQIEDLMASKHAADIAVASKNTTGTLTQDDLDKAVSNAMSEQGKVDATGTLLNIAPWFDPKKETYDPVMAGAAVAMDASVAVDPEFMGKSVGEQMSEVKKRIEERFNYKDSDEKNGPPTGAPPGPPRVGSVKTGSRGIVDGDTVTLSSEQAQVARMMFAGDPEAELKYAEQLKYMKDMEVQE